MFIFFQSLIKQSSLDEPNLEMEFEERGFNNSEGDRRNRMALLHQKIAEGDEAALNNENGGGNNNSNMGGDSYQNYYPEQSEQESPPAFEPSQPIKEKGTDQD